LIIHFPPVHGSWLNQVEQWWPVVPRKHQRIADTSDTKPLSQRVLAVVAAWHEHAQPFQ